MSNGKILAIIGGDCDGRYRYLHRTCVFSKVGGRKEPLLNELDKTTVENILQHHGVLGMRWGHRKAQLSHPAIAHIPKATRKEAHKDAEEFTRAKLYFGQGAGTRRKLIKATVESKRKRDPLYGKAFDHFVEGTHLGQRAVQARRERKRTDTKNYAKKTAKGVRQILQGNNQYANSLAILGVAGGTYLYKTRMNHGVIDDILSDHGSDKL